MGVERGKQSKKRRGALVRSMEQCLDEPESKQATGIGKRKEERGGGK